MCEDGGESKGEGEGKGEGEDEGKGEGDCVAPVMNPPRVASRYRASPPGSPQLLRVVVVVVEADGSWGRSWRSVGGALPMEPAAESVA